MRSLQLSKEHNVVLKGFDAASTVWHGMAKPLLQFYVNRF